MILLDDVETEFGRIQIIESKRDGNRTYRQEECYHSEANAEGISTCAYVHVMYSIMRQSVAKDVLMIGCAGGSLATMLSRLGCNVTVVDINLHAFTLARKYFQMPETIECIVEDGWSYLLRTENRYDAIAIDAFSGDASIPEQFTTYDFFVLAKEMLQPRGVIAMNVMVAHDLDMFADRLALTMQSAGVPATLFDWPGRADRNTIVAGGAVSEMQVFSHNKPKFVREEMLGIKRRTSNLRAANLADSCHSSKQSL